MSGLGLGARCVRGPDWQWGDQDGGPGHVGTIVLLGQPGHPLCPPGTVEVLWDTGLKQNYRVGHSNAYDLRLVDNGPCGVLHLKSNCTNCGVSGIAGMRWSCIQCSNTDLCTKCYMLRYHDVTHDFIRYVDLVDPGVRVGARVAAQQTEIFGAFKGAVVVRGQDWTWENQDGGAGTQGRIVNIVDWQGQTVRSVASVVWPHKGDNMYRLGHKGKVDLTCVVPGSGGKVFYQHLPLLGKGPETTAATFIIGQAVMVNVDLETLKQMQQGHGGFHAKMAGIQGRRGKVHRITEKGDVRVQYPGEPPQDHRWAINPLALRVILGHSVGDSVTVTSDRKLIEKYHHNPSALDSILGSTGRITLVHSETSIVVDFGSARVHTLHPGIVSPPKQLPDSGQAGNNNFIRAAALGDLSGVDSYLSGGLTDSSSLQAGLHKAVGHGFINVAVSILRFRPGLVNELFLDKTVLMIAAHEGNTSMIEWLVQCGADPGIGDKVGDTALHYAAIATQAPAILTLVDKGANINCVNRQKRSPLHLAVIGRNEEVVKAILKLGANVNLQDCNGETPLHIAILSSSHTIIDLILPQADLLLFNHQSCNALHLAAGEGDVTVIKRVLRQDSSLVNIVNREGASALHIAARRSVPALMVILETPQCDVNIQDGQGRTVLHWASSRLDLAVVKLLVENRADTGTRDGDGNTPAHLAATCNPHLVAATVDGPPIEESGGMPQDGATAAAAEGAASHHVETPYYNELEDIFDRNQLRRLQQLGLSRGQILEVAVLGFLLRRLQVSAPGSDLANQDGYTPLDLVQNPHMKTFLLEYLSLGGACGGSTEHEYAEITETPDTPLEQEPECRVCSEKGPLVQFSPCQHHVACAECSLRVKKCLECHAPVEKRSPAEGAVSSEERERLKSLEMKVQDLEDQFLCGICMERKRNVAFLCGHGACTQCTQGLETCHMCRTAIERKIPLY